MLKKTLIIFLSVLSVNTYAACTQNDIAMAKSFVARTQKMVDAGILANAELYSPKLELLKTKLCASVIDQAEYCKQSNTYISKWQKGIKSEDGQSWYGTSVEISNFFQNLRKIRLDCAI